MNQRSAKRLQTTFLCCSNSTCKYNLTFPLTFMRLEKTKDEIVNFVHLPSFLLSFFLAFFLSSASHINHKLCCVCGYLTYQTIALLMKIIPGSFELHLSYYMYHIAENFGRCKFCINGHKSLRINFHILNFVYLCAWIMPDP